MVTLENQEGVQFFWNILYPLKDGRIRRWKRTSKTKRWKCKLEMFEFSVRSNLQYSITINNAFYPNNAREWLTWDPTEAMRLPKQVNLPNNAPVGVIYDRLLDAGREEDAKLWRRFCEEVKGVAWKNVPN